jgi:hypothetical protein
MPVDSLGGALATTLVGAGMLPDAFSGDVTVVSLGGPATFFGPVTPKALGKRAADARVLSVVNGHDVVPRLLGSRLELSRSLLSIFASNTNTRRQKANEEVLDTLESYTRFPQLNLIFLEKVYQTPIMFPCGCTPDLRGCLPDLFPISPPCPFR